MEIAGPFHFGDNKRQKIMSEYNINFKLGQDTEQDLLEWLDIRTEKRVNIYALDGYIFTEDFFEKLTKVKAPVAIRVSEYQIEQMIPLCKKYDIPFFLDRSCNICCFTQLEEVLEMGVSDVYPLGDLCYDLPRVRILCNDYEVRMRLIPNLMNIIYYKKVNNKKASWYTPENMFLLEQYYDIVEFEFYEDWTRFDALVEIWIDKQKWPDDLKYIIFDLRDSIPNQSLNHDLCLYKMQCKKKCFGTSSCNKCIQYIELAKIMNDKDIVYLDKKWVKINKEILEKDSI